MSPWLSPQHPLNRLARSATALEHRVQVEPARERIVEPAVRPELDDGVRPAIVNVVQAGPVIQFEHVSVREGAQDVRLTKILRTGVLLRPVNIFTEVL